MTLAQGMVILLFFITVICSILWVITGYNPFKKKPSPFPPPRYRIRVDGYGKYCVEYLPATYEPDWYIRLPKTFDTLEFAEKHVEWHKDWLIRKESKIIKEID